VGGKEGWGGGSVSTFMNIIHREYLYVLNNRHVGARARGGDVREHRETK